MTIITLIIYVVFGIALVVLSLALHDRLRQDSPAIANPLIYLLTAVSLILPLIARA